jgi:hypothetical protein
MSIKDHLGPEIVVIEDSRASKRGKGTPSKVKKESSGRYGDRANQITQLVNREVVPVAFIDASNNVWLLSAGGSGLIVYESGINDPLSAEQDKVIEAVEEAIKKHFGIKDKKAKKDEPDTVLGVVDPAFPTDWPDTIADVALEENG